MARTLSCLTFFQYKNRSYHLSWLLVVSVVSSVQVSNFLHASIKFMSQLDVVLKQHHRASVLPEEVIGKGERTL